MNEQNSPGSDSILRGRHGFAWMFSIDCAGLGRVGPFHLFNRPSKKNEWGKRNWNYCGKYRAHRTGYLMTTEGWDALPDKVSSILTSHSGSVPYPAPR